MIMFISAGCIAQIKCAFLLVSNARHCFLQVTKLKKTIFKTGKTVTLDADTHIEVPQDRYGLYAIDSLDPDMVSAITYLCSYGSFIYD